MEKENPAFTAELDVSRGSSYGRFISGVRNELVLHAGATRHLELVLLQPQEEDPRKAPWFRVALRCSSSGDSVLLRVRADNLYISGYQSPDGRWWEFRAGSVIHAATQLAFTDSYESMGRAAGLELDSVTLSKKDLEAAVRQLAAAAGRRPNAGAGGSSQQDTARSLMVVAVMVCEAIRFRSVAGALAHIMCGAARFGPLPAHMVAQVKNWSSLSEYWLGAALYGQKFLPLVGTDGPAAVRPHPAAPACACEDRLPGPRHDGAWRRAQPAEAAGRQAQGGARRALARRARPSTQARQGEDLISLAKGMVCGLGKCY
jgi:RNA-binding protein Musashi